MSQRISQLQLEAYLWGAATLLRGTIDAGDYKQFIFPLLFYKRLCDVFDEETKAALKESGGDEKFAAYPENHRFQVPAPAHWGHVRQASKNIGAALQSAMRTIETANQEKLYGIFGDAQWTNKDRLSDALLRDLIEHFSSHELSIANLPEDELGQGYEYLIKKFADDAGHTAAEFYTNRTVVHLMTEMLDVQPGESVYDPTCGSGGMLLSCITHLRRQGKEWRNVRLFGQERNLMTSSIARMNCFLHGIEDFRIERGDTLSEPKLVQRDRLQRFDVVLANPPYSIKQWDREVFAADPWGRNIFGTPPQGRADYAFWQHILCSLTSATGRCAILFPHGVLFRQEEAEMRRKLIESDILECVLGLGPSLFYNSTMEACIVICRTAKPKARKERVLFIDAVNEVTRERSQSLLTNEHIKRILQAYKKFKDEPGFSVVATLDEIRAKDGNLSIPIYITPESTPLQKTALASQANGAPDALTAWLVSSMAVRKSVSPMIGKLTNFDHFKPGPHWDRLPLFSHKGWKTVRFGDVVMNHNGMCDPAKAGLDRFIGLEHLEPGSLHIRRWGNVEDGTTFTRRCLSGQVLFGKRRAYQRKVALADFDAVVSGDIYVLSPKGEHLLPELIPFLCLSDQFIQHAVGTSAGSLSPRTNWSSLARFEFALPPVDQQRRFAELLWDVDGVVQTSTAFFESLEVRHNSLVSHLLQNGVEKTEVIDTICGPIPRRWKVLPLGDLLELRRQIVQVRPREEYREIGIRSHGKGIFHKEPTTGAKIGDKRVFVVEPNLLVLNIVFAWEAALAITGQSEAGFIASHRFPMYASRNDQVSLEFYLLYLLSQRGMKAIGNASPGGAGRNRTLGQKEFLRIPVPCPSGAEQLEVVARIRESKEIVFAAKKKAELAKQLRAVLIELLVTK